MPITKLEFRPGINREGTAYSEQGNWYDCDKIRFRNGRPEKIGGWVQTTTARFKGIARMMMDWVLLNSKKCLAIGTHKKMYIEESGVFNDITPIRFTDTNTDPITTGGAGTSTHTYETSAPHGAVEGDYVVLSNILADVDGICTDSYTNPFTTLAASSYNVRVDTVTPHYAVVGDTVTFSGASGFDGIPAGDFNTDHTIIEVLSSTSYIINTATAATAGSVTGGGTVSALYLARLNREFEIVSIPTTTTFTFTTDTTCTAGSVTGGGVDVVADFLVSNGSVLNMPAAGWSSGYWSRGTWSSSYVPTVSNISLRIWSADNYGEDLIYCPRDGALYYWDATAGLSVRGVLLSGIMGASDVPDNVSIVRVTDDRHVLAIGCTDRVSGYFDPLLVRWSSQENPLDWTPSTTNTSGSQRIPLGSYVVAGLTTRQETLIWTDHSLHSLQYTGAPYTFSLQTLAENTSIAGPNAAVNVDNVTFWMGTNRFWMYSGRAQALECSVQRYVYDDCNLDQLPQVYASANDGFTEVTWFYCSKDSTEIDRYVTYNYGDQVWTIGTLNRTAMVQCSTRTGVFATQYGEDDDGILYQHEVGYDDGSTNPPGAIEAYIESADFEVNSGDKLLFLDRVIPDVTFSRSTVDSPELTITLEAKKFPGQATMSEDDRAVIKSVTVDQYTNQVWMRLRGRSFRLKVLSDALGVSWLLGTVRANIRLDGRQ